VLAIKTLLAQSGVSSVPTGLWQSVQGVLCLTQAMFSITE